MFVSYLLLERIYFYIAKGSFQKMSFLGIEMISTQVYVAKVDNLSLFKNENERDYFSYIFQKAEEKGLNYKACTLPWHFWAKHYTDVQSLIQKETSLYFKNKFKDEALNPKNVKYMNTLLVSVASKLFFANYKDFLKLYISKIYIGVKDYHFLILIFSIFIIFLILSFINYSEQKFFIFIVSLAAILNYMLVAIFEYITNRYMFYTNNLLISLVLIFIIEYFKKAKFQ